jgi:aspartyl-tRNA(Asn)/glutamyl-tRNA(Gln) amidotransferase subunit B
MSSADEGYTFTVGIERLHLEQDAGKSIHDLDPNATYVDLNRSGVALMEIVSRPDIRSPAEAAAYVKKLRSILIALGTCDGDMEKGNLRADVNVSVCRPGGYDHYKRNRRASKSSARAARSRTSTPSASSRWRHRIRSAAPDRDPRRRRQDRSGDPPVTTPDKDETRSMRSKEDAHDYRYFPDPDLLPLELDRASTSKHPRQTARTAGPEARALREGLRPQGYDAGVSRAMPEKPHTSKPSPRVAMRALPPTGSRRICSATSTRKASS